MVLQHQLLGIQMKVHLLVHPVGHWIAVQMMLEPVRSYVSGTISGTIPCRVSSMRPRSSNLPQVDLPSVGLVFARQVVLQIAYQVLEHDHVRAPSAHDVASVSTRHAQILHQ